MSAICKLQRIKYFICQFIKQVIQRWCEFRYGTVPVLIQTVRFCCVRYYTTPPNLKPGDDAIHFGRLSCIQATPDYSHTRQEAFLTPWTWCVLDPLTVVEISRWPLDRSGNLAFDPLTMSWPRSRVAVWDGCEWPPLVPRSNLNISLGTIGYCSLVRIYYWCIHGNVV